MNDNEPPLYCSDPPDWAWDIIDKHDLAARTDCPLAAATVLLTDAADLLKEASLSAHREQAISPETKRLIAECKTMIADAEKLYPLCPTQPVAGTVTESDDGTLTWSPDSAHS